MSQPNIDKVQIPGTMYHLQLTADRGRWILALLLRGGVENEAVVPVFSKNSIIKAANELLNNSRLVIDKYPLKNVCDQLFAEAEHSLPITTPAPEEIVDTIELDGMKQKIDLLENTVENVNEELKEMINGITERLDSLENDRVARLEAELSRQGDKRDEDMFTSLASRLDTLEESHVATSGDDRVPSILTAIEAIESKVSQLEGRAITTEGGSLEVPVAPSADISGYKDDFGRLSRALDLISQRLTNLENQLKPKPPVIEGAENPKPPTEM
jgi:tetrahydromethanopterin S-methyltransferase subunit G